ncbi:MAG: hypothetical protein GY856_37850 [bacterium]|nr:hypothetical protein [bacterium]
MSYNDASEYRASWDARELTQTACDFLQAVTDAANLDTKNMVCRLVNWTEQDYERWKEAHDEATLHEYLTFLLIAVSSLISQRLQSDEEGRESGGPELPPSFYDGIPYVEPRSPAYDPSNAHAVSEEGIAAPPRPTEDLLRFLDPVFQALAELVRKKRIPASDVLRKLEQWKRWIGGDAIAATTDGPEDPVS